MGVTPRPPDLLKLVAMDDAALEVRQTEEYARWFAGLRDRRAKARRIYFVREGQSMIVLVGGGDKGSQTRDIEKAHRVAQALAESG